MPSRIKTRAFEIIQPADGRDAASRCFDIVLVMLILFNVVAVFIDTLDLPQAAHNAIAVFDVVSIALFTAEYILRIWTADLLYPDNPAAIARMKYVFSFMGLVDLLSIAPFYIPSSTVDLRILRLLRIFRLLRVLKLGHYSDSMALVGRVLKSRKDQLASSILVIMILIVIASVVMFDVEHEAQPEAFSNAFSSLWWAVATLTTVGYGDIYPITTLGKVISAVIALLGIGLVAVPSGIISAGFIDALGGEEKRCPHCGKLV